MQSKRKSNIPSTFTAIVDWLAIHEFVLMFKNIPPSGTKEFHFGKEGTRVCVFFPYKEETYCQLVTTIFDKDKKDVTVTSTKFLPFDDATLFKYFNQQQNLKRRLEGGYDTKQIYWEIWMYSSLIIFAVVILAGMMAGSMDMFPNWPYAFVIALVNIIVCFVIGTNTKR
jgi:hypothetical protein